MHPLLEYLKSPELVVKVQEYFGIEYQKSSPLFKNRKITGTQNGTANGKGVPSNGFSVNHADEKKIDDNDNAYRVTNYFWYVLFIIGTELGDELFYATFIPFWFWNIDSAVGRRVVMVWSAIMYVGNTYTKITCNVVQRIVESCAIRYLGIPFDDQTYNGLKIAGQSLKDIIRWPRPSYPAARLQKKWGLEYGMPSTHAMVSVAIPFSVLIYTYDRYIYSMPVGLAIACVWCTVICVSRVYLGMHSVLDIIAGLILVVLLMIPLIPIVDRLDLIIVTSRWSPIFVFSISILLIVFYPDSGKWTPTRGDTALTVSVCAGIELGAWLHFHLGEFQQPAQPPPYEIIWPSYSMFGLLLLRTVLGLCCILASRAFAKSISYAFVCFILGRDKNELRQSEDTLENKNKIIVELSYKLFTYGVIGFNTQYLLPSVFKLLNIGRPDFYTEI